MKKTRRIAAMLAAMALAATMVAPTMMNASATNVSIDVTGDNTTHTYTAYKIFDGVYNATLGLTITDWATGYNGTGLAGDSAFRALTYSNNTNVGAFLGNSIDAASVAQAIEKLGYTDGSPEADALATILQKYIGQSGTAISQDSSNATSLAAGYWIVVDSYTVGTSTPTNDAFSKYVLKVNGGDTPIVITPKKSYPTVVKKVKENTDVSDYTYSAGGTDVTDADYNDVADYNIGDSVPFKLYGTLPSTYADYSHYYYCFTDTLGSQFTAPTAADITVKVNGTTISNASGNMRVGVSGQVITVSFEDIKVFAPNATDVITVEYSAVLNNTANIGLDGQENKVDLEYSNNPNITYNPNTSDDNEDKPKDDNGTPDNTSDDKDATDKTPEDKVIVFTYEQDIKKVDAATGAVLDGAVFNLYKTVNVEGTNTNYYVQVDANNKVTGWTTNASQASGLTTGADGICKVIGLDDGTYYITEKTAPADYNLITGAMQLTINATTINSQTWSGTASDALTAIALSASGNTAISDDSTNLTSEQQATKGIVQAKITNEKGVQLPNTGGMGTKLFIAGGGITATLAAVYLVSKKRSKED